MIISSKNGHLYEIKSFDGKRLKYIQEFNTETKEAVLYTKLIHDDGTTGHFAKTRVGDKMEYELKTVKSVLIGYNAYDRITGNLVK